MPDVRIGVRGFAHPGPILAKQRPEPQLGGFRVPRLHLIRAVRFDPRSGQTLGDSFTVFEPQQPRLTLFDVNPGTLEIGIAKDKLVMLLAERTSNLWVTALEP